MLINGEKLPNSDWKVLTMNGGIFLSSPDDGFMFEIHSFHELIMIWDFNNQSLEKYLSMRNIVFSLIEEA